MSAVAPSYLGSRHCRPRRPHPCRESSGVYTDSCDPHVPSPKSAETWQRPLNHYLVPRDFHVGSLVKHLEVDHQDLRRTSARHVKPCSKKSERGSSATSKGSKLFQPKIRGGPVEPGSATTIKPMNPQQTQTSKALTLFPWTLNPRSDHHNLKACLESCVEGRSDFTVSYLSTMPLGHWF